MRGKIMGVRCLLPALLLVALSMGLGALLGDVLRSPDDAEVRETVDRQAARIAELTHEVRRLRGPPEPSLVGRAGPEAASPVPEAHAEKDAATPPPPPEDAVQAGPLRPAATPATRPQAGGMLDWIRALTARDARQTDTALVGDPEQMSLLFSARADGPTLRAEEMRPEAPVADGTTIALDAGVYDFSAFAGAHRGDFPADVSFRGVGMDRTLLVLHEIASTGEARNLGFEDLTLDTRGHYLADVRGDEPISLRFERARVIGFDQKPGGAVLLAARHGAVLARDTRFEAGFGNAPGTGSFFHVRGPFLVRFERCAFVGPYRSLYEKSERASYAWVRCTFERLPEALRRDIEAPDANLRFEDGSYEYLPVGEPLPPARSRAELNPAWR